MTREVPHVSASRQVLAELKRMTRAELLQTFVDAGTHTKSGRLTKRYRPDPIDRPRPVR